MKYEFETEFDLGDRVYHKVPESSVGIITGIVYDAILNIVTYHITFDPQDGEVKCYGFELSTNKTIV